MEIISLCPFTVGTLIWQGQGGAWTLSTCVKGTFSLVHGRDALIAEEQEPVGVDRYFADGGGSLYSPSDVVPYKPRTDVVLVGHAYAPKGQVVDALVARFTIGDLSKAVGIVGDRLWTEGPYGLEPAPPAPFTRMPLRYERAARAPGNPIGVDLATPPLAGRRALPNLEPVDDDAATVETVGFGPVPPMWASRRGLLQGTAWAWVSEGGLGPVPEGFDFGFYNAAPPDQQIGLLRQGARIVLENLHPEHARLETRLPQIRPKAFLIDRETQRGSEIALRCDTIWIDTDRALAVVTWRGLTDVATGDARALGTLAVAAELKGKELRFKHVERLLREEGLTSADTESFTMVEVNPLNIRYDGRSSAADMESDLSPPERAGDAALHGAGADIDVAASAAGMSVPSADLLRPGFHWAPSDGGSAGEAASAGVGDAAMEGAQAVPPVPAVPAHAGAQAGAEPVFQDAGGPGADAVGEDLTQTELETQKFRVDEVEREILNSAEERAGSTTGVDVSAAEAPTHAVRSADPADEAPAPPQSAPVVAPPRLDEGLVPPPAVVMNAPPPTPPGMADTDPPSPAFVTDMPQFGEPPDPPPVLEAPAAAAEPAPAPGLAERSISIEDYARIVIALERGDMSRILARYKLEPPEVERLRAQWTARLASDPLLNERLDEALETARWE